MFDTIQRLNYDIVIPEGKTVTDIVLDLAKKQVSELCTNELALALKMKLSRDIGEALVDVKYLRGVIYIVFIDKGEVNSIKLYG